MQKINKAKGYVPSGQVSIVGAGPGDPELLTIKALKRIRKADVIAYDRLVNAVILNEASESAEKIYVGKHAPKTDGVAKRSWTQEEINSLLIEKAKKGLDVVRLKGGDPFIFGRGSEEAIALRQENIEYEIIPGISSSVAAPAYAGIPVTHRHISTSFAVIAGHEDPNKGDSTVNWSALAQLETLVILMGVGRLEIITKTLIKHGRAADTPTALIRWGTTYKQESLVAPLAEIAMLAKAQNFKAPASFVVGEVVALRDDLQWFDNEFDQNLVKNDIPKNSILEDVISS